MRFVSYTYEGQVGAGLVAGEEVIPLRGIGELGVETPIELLEDPSLDTAAAVPYADVKLRPVIPRPEKIICVGLNYKSHIQETGREDSDYPVLFGKFPGALTAPGATIELPPESHQVDYEGELAVIMGRAGRRISEDRALEHVAGYAVANDVTMRDYQYLTHQWLQGKTWDATTPLGPELVLKDEVADTGDLGLVTKLNGETVQDSSTSLLIFPIARLISICSTFTTLKPGDVILTGTPGGVGYRRDPKRLLVDGDEISVEIQGVGRIANRFVTKQEERA
jgi:acylpyruvate hydrolase